MKVYYDDARTYPGSRLHPYGAGATGQTGHVDLRAHPELIETALEDFVPFAQRAATRAFYDLLREVNGPASHLETSDCAYRAPKPHQDPNSPLALCTVGRLYVLFRDLRLNCIGTQVEWLCGKLMAHLNETDPTLTAAQGVVAFTRVRILYTALSRGAWRPEGFEAEPNDPGHGEQVMLSFFAYGNTEDEVDANLLRVFRNTTASCTLISNEIAAALAALNRGQQSPAP
jgi:hypothetical protein